MPISETITWLRVLRELPLGSGYIKESEGRADRVKVQAQQHLDGFDPPGIETARWAVQPLLETLREGFDYWEWDTRNRVMAISSFVQREVEDSGHYGMGLFCTTPSRNGESCS